MSNNEKNRFNSKIKKVFLELHNYSFSHSSFSNISSSKFLGRRQIFQRLKSLLSNTSSKTGVYLVAGNRGVGKTRLVDEVIKDTSSRSDIRLDIIYLISIFVGVLFTQYLLRDIGENILCLKIVLIVLIIFTSILFTNVSLYTRQNYKSALINFWYHIKSILHGIINIPNFSIPEKRARALSISLIILLTVITISLFTPLTSIAIFFVYLSILVAKRFLYYIERVV